MTNPITLNDDDDAKGGKSSAAIDKALFDARQVMIVGQAIIKETDDVQDRDVIALLDTSDEAA